MTNWKIDLVQLPVEPEKVGDDWPPDFTSSRMPGDLPFIIGFGKKERKIIAEGWLYETGRDKAYLRTTYIDPLKAKVGKKVTLSQSSGYDGDYIFGCTFEERAGITRAFWMKLTFVQGSQYEVL